MSIYSEISRFADAITDARRRRNTARILNSLPPEIQRDIGWPVPKRVDRAQFYRTLWSSSR